METRYYCFHPTISFKVDIWRYSTVILTGTCKKRQKIKLTQLWLDQVPQLQVVVVVHSPQLQSDARNHQATRNRRHMAKIKPELRLAQVSPTLYIKLIKACQQSCNKEIRNFLAYHGSEITLQGYETGSELFMHELYTVKQCTSGY